jgi:uncharacterized membrane protein
MIKDYFINMLCIILLLLIIDLPMIMLINNDMYSKHLLNINKEPMKFDIIAIIFTYLLMALSINYFIISNLDNSINYINIFFKGAILGFIIYGIYNGTNKSTINNWGIFESIIDTLWGTFLFGITSILSAYIIQNKII